MITAEELQGVVKHKGRRRLARLVVNSGEESLLKRAAAVNEVVERRAKGARAHRNRKADPVRHAARKKYNREWRKANPQAVRAYREAYRKTEAYRDYQKRWKDKNRVRTGYKRGEDRPASKLTTTQVIEMRARYAAGELSMAKLATAYGVSFAAAHKIIRRLTWTHVP